ncbi:hypothetical protein BP5796_12045 [Coleophoma crateriformis]|uniref:Heterokaryon incompatibility domain-containing protein n=1 Tax=Coleophoma crateriformis TaxID=565419 RepID=A0A3D8QBL8_9HELO|nr:hypothetical protein BP5796_12045 [Coleophoma crateriformis]
MASNSNSFLRVDREWPLRLLHIPTMRSMERQGENIYGTVAEPEYNILSYTWGRWQISRGPALPIQDTTWNIPPVSPDHFSVADFERVLDHMRHTHDFAWVDIACIDQENEELKADQVGKQAAIFHGADSPFIWLNSHNTAEINNFATKLRAFEDEIAGEDSGSLRYCRDEGWLNAINQVLGGFLKAPWFSSLWTLQEAFLRNDAVFLSREGEVAMNGAVPFTLWTLITSCVVIYRRIRNFIDDSNIPPILYNEIELQKVVTLLDDVGIYPLFLSNPLALYAASQKRQAKDERDKVYGIMQIFGLKLKQTSSTIDELEYEFGRALLTESPVLSQCFIHTRPATKGERWRISQNFQVPEKCNGFVKPQSCCHIEWSKPGRAPIFKGEMCRASQIIEQWSEASYHSGRPNTRSVQNIAVDFGDVASRDIPESLRMQIHLPNDERQHELAQWLVAIYEDLCIFKLGKVQGHAYGRRCDLWFGILVVPTSRGDQREIVWERVGICHWEMMLELQGTEDSIWSIFEGVLG